MNEAPSGVLADPDQSQTTADRVIVFGFICFLRAAEVEL